MVSATEQRRFAGVVLVVLLLDLATKLAAEIWLRRYVGVSVIGELFQLRLVYNPGAAFGINVGGYSRWVFMALSIAALFVLGGMLRATRAGDKVRLFTRRGYDWSDRYPAIAATAMKLRAQSFTLDGEANPFLGVRVLRLCRARPEIFVIQLRALARAAVRGNLKVMFPMVTSASELEAGRKLFAEVAQARQDQGAQPGHSGRPGELGGGVLVGQHDVAIRDRRGHGVGVAQVVALPRLIRVAEPLLGQRHGDRGARDIVQEGAQPLLTAGEEVIAVDPVLLQAGPQVAVQFPEQVPGVH